MDTDGHAFALHLVLLDLGHVVGDVVDLVDAGILHLTAQDVVEAAADEMGQQLAIAEGKVGRALHGRQVVLPLRAAEGSADQFAVGQDDVVLVDDLLKAGHVVGADLMAKAARAAVNLGHDLAGEEAHRRRGRLVEDLIDDIDFDEVVARAQRAQLVARPLIGPGADLVRVGAVDAAVLLGALQVHLRGVAALQRPARPLAHHLVHLLAAQLELAAAADAVGAVALQLRRQVVQVGGDVVAAEARAQQPHAAVDVIAHAAGGDHAVGHAGGDDAADGEAVALVDVGHGQGIGDDARQRGAVDQLIEALVAQRRAQQLGVGIEPRRHAHVVAVLLGYLVQVRRDSLQVLLVHALLLERRNHRLHRFHRLLL